MLKTVIQYLVAIIFLVNHSKTTSLSENPEELNDFITNKTTTRINNKETLNNNITDNLIDVNFTISNLNNTKDVNETLKILQDEKSKLYKEIMKSIDDSVLLLENTNDTEAILGVDFMKELKYQLEKINGTDSYLPKKDDKDIQRRSLVEKKIKLTYEEIASLFRKQNKTATIFTPSEIGVKDLEIKKKIDDWILQRQLEKQKILDYKQKVMRSLAKLEKCPRLGLDKKTIRVDGKTRKRYRPCCRKCCKASYMGCL